MGRLQGKVAFITGATGGIGRHTAGMFAREGAAVVLAGRREAEGEAAAAEIRGAGGAALFTQCDVSEEASVAQAVAKAVAAFGPITVLFNNAGGSRPTDGPLTEAPLGEFWKSIKLDLYGTWLCSRAIIPHMIEAGGGAIVNSASIMGVMGVPKRDAYTAAKGGVVSLTKSMAVEYAPHRIRVNVIVPGAVMTDRVKAMFAKEPHLKKQEESYLLGFAQPDHVGYAAIYLASDEAGATTGHTLLVEGGITIS
jgi:NAD(P)-dependent dehydrogenase (short-subunit alcohol dehydrogenase family)